MMEAEDLLKDIRRLNNSMQNRHRKRIKETKNDYIKRKSRYHCSYCHRQFNKNRLNVSLEPFHHVKKNDNLFKITSHYNVSRETLEELNPSVNFDNLSAGEFINVPKFYKIFPNTHGVCYCGKCSKDRNRLGLTHADYIKNLLEQRRNERSKVTPEFRKAIYEVDNHNCVYCEIEYGKQKNKPKLTLDHKIPIAKGGETTKKNMITSCEYHNKDKDKMDYHLYIQKIKKRRFEKELEL